jgi:hypothetical protein
MKIRMLKFLRLAIIFAPFALASCSEDDGLGSRPFVPADGYSCTLTISVPKEATVGEWIPLKASCASGPWKQVNRSDVTNLAQAFRESPPAVEDNVQASLFWFTEPTNEVRFNVATLQSVSEDPKRRQVVFSKPGVYKIWAVAASPSVVTSVVETVTISLKK